MSKKKSSFRKSNTRKSSYLKHLRGLGLALPAAGSLVMASAPAALAFQLYDGTTYGNNLEINLSTEVSYTGLYRTGQPSYFLENGTYNNNGNDGDSNLRHGIVGNTFEVLPTLDIKDNNFGMHFSGEYFLNTVYLQGNHNNQGATVNSIVSSTTSFASSTRQANGQNGRMLDAFVYDSWNFGQSQILTLKAGKQTLFWGQSLFFGGNGISGGQAPIDVVSAQNLVNPQTQQIYLPVGQFVATYKPNDTYTLQAYYQFEWVPYSLQGVGSFFSTSDVVGPGADRIIAQSAGNAYNSSFYFYKTKAITPPSQNGQFGGSIQAQYGNYDVGLFGLRFDSKTPTVYDTVGPFDLSKPGGASIGSYQLVYPRDIWLGGASVSTTIGATNVAGEISGRAHTQLAGAAAPLAFGVPSQGNANSNPLYPTGDTLTALASFIYGSPTLKYVPGGVTLLGELEYVNVLSVTANKAELAPGRSESAAAFDVQVVPAYDNVLPNLNLSFPVSLKYNLAGNSQFDSTMNEGTGSWSIGASATYYTTWTASLAYVGQIGQANSNGEAPRVNPSADRSYINLGLSHTF